MFEISQILWLMIMLLKSHHLFTIIFFSPGAALPHEFTLSCLLSLGYQCHSSGCPPDTRLKYLTIITLFVSFVMLGHSSSYTPNRSSDGEETILIVLLMTDRNLLTADVPNIFFFFYVSFSSQLIWHYGSYTQLVV
jgi:hypothetical protein